MRYIVYNRNGIIVYDTNSLLQAKLFVRRTNQNLVIEDSLDPNITWFINTLGKWEKL